MSGPSGVVTRDEDAHAHGVSGATRALASVGVVVDDELRLDDADRLSSRLTLSLGEPSIVGYVTVSTRPGSGPTVGTTSLRARSVPSHRGAWRDELVLGRGEDGLLRVVSRSVVGLRRVSYEAPTNAEVVALTALARSIAPSVRFALGRDPRLENLREALDGPGDVPRAWVLLATEVLTEVASGTPLEWAVRRAAETSPR